MAQMTGAREREGAPLCRYCHGTGRAATRFPPGGICTYCQGTGYAGGREP